MRITLLLLLLAITGGCTAQTAVADTTAPVNKWQGEITTSETKLGHIHYLRLNQAVDMDLFLIKYTDLGTGYTEKGISMGGTVTTDVNTTVNGVIWEKDLDKFIRAFHFVWDSLLAKKPTEKTIYSNNTLGPDIVLRAEFNPYDKKMWVVTFCFGVTADSWVIIDGEDCKDLEKLLLEGKKRLAEI